MTQKLSIVTGTKDRPDSFRRFFRSVLLQATVETEVIVVDATESPYAAAIMREETAECEIDLVRGRTIHENPPIGVMRGYNRGFRACTSEFVIWMNDDCELLPGWDKTAVDFMEAHPEVGIGCVYFADKKSDGSWKSAICEEDVRRIANKEIPAGTGRREQIFEVQSLYGIVYANFGILRRELGDEIGWFDETLGYSYGCDNAICNEAIIRGKAVVPIPNCNILHHREYDDARAEHRPKCRGDRKLFDDKWEPRSAELRGIMSQFKHLEQPKVTRIAQADILTYGE